MLACLLLLKYFKLLFTLNSFANLYLLYLSMQKQPVTCQAFVNALLDIVTIANVNALTN